LREGPKNGQDLFWEQREEECLVADEGEEALQQDLRVRSYWRIWLRDRVVCLLRRQHQTIGRVRHRVERRHHLAIIRISQNAWWECAHADADSTFQSLLWNRGEDDGVQRDAKADCDIGTWRKGTRTVGAEGRIQVTGSSESGCIRKAFKCRPWK